MSDEGERIARLEAMVGDMRGALARLEPMIIKILENQAEMRGEMRGQFDQMGQRVSDLNARLPGLVAYAPPPKKPAA